MSEQKTTPETGLPTPESGDQLPFRADDVKRDMSFSLKSTYTLPAITVKYILDQLTAEINETLEDETADKSLEAVYKRLLDRVLKKFKRTDSPGYIALTQYIASQVPVTKVPAGEVTQDQGAGAAAAETAQAAARIFPDEPVSVSRKFPDIMNMDLGEAIRAIFPSIGDVVLQAVRLKMVQGPNPDEAGNLQWQVNFFVDLVARFKPLHEDLLSQGFSIESVARMLFSRGQLEASRAEIVRSERRSGRGAMNTLPGVRVEEVQLYIAKELSIAGKPLPRADQPDGDAVPLQQDGAGVDELSGLGAPADGNKNTDAAVSPADDADDDIHSRRTITPDEALPAAVDRSEQITVTNEAASQAAGDRLPTLRVDTREVRSRLATVPLIAISAGADQPAATQRSAGSGDDSHNLPTLPPPDGQQTSRPKKTLGSRLRGLFGVKPGEEEEK